MDKYKLLEEDERSTKTKLGLKILGFCFCAMFLASVLLNVYYLRNMTKDKSVVHTGHISKHGPELTMTKNSKRNNMGMNLKNTVRKSSHVDLKKIVNQDDALRAAVAKIQIQQDDCTEDCGYEILGTALICGAYYSDEDDWIDCMITYTSYDCFDCLCELLETEEGYSCSVNDKKKMNQKAKLVKPTKNVGACEGGADCGDGWCCYDADYPVCCPDTDFYTNWCAVDFDSCADLSKTLPKMAAKKKVDLKNIDNKEDALRAAAAKIQIQQDDCTEDCGYEILGTALICGAYYSDEDDWIDCMITYTSYDCFDCLCELLEAEEGYSCSVNDKKKMNQKAKLVKPTKNVGACEGGADCGDGWCCYDADYPVCCPDTDFYTNWCAVDADSCPQSSKTLPETAAKKKLLKSMKMIGDEQCDGTDCGNGWCCNDDDYSICCPICDDGTQWCAGCADDCPDCVINNIRDMAANK